MKVLLITLANLCAASPYRIVTHSGRVRRGRIRIGGYSHLVAGTSLLRTAVPTNILSHKCGLPVLDEARMEYQICSGLDSSGA